MRFKQIVRRKVYPTWVSIRKYAGCKIYIMKMGDLYHFQVFCDDLEAYSDKRRFLEFEDCRSAAKAWVKENLTKIKNNYRQ